MDSGHLYFIDDSYYVKYNYRNMEPNKVVDSNGNPHDRPYYYAFSEDNISWMVPVSSKTEKYEKIYNKKTKDGKTCDTIAFGFVRGNKNAFLIQNMIPVKDEYITKSYIDKSNNKPVSVNEKKKKELNAKVRKVLRLTRSGKVKIVFTPILEIEKDLKK